MKLFRKILFWCHLSVGVVAGLVILLMSVTGVLLTYEKQMLEWADTRSFSIAPQSALLSVEALLAKARESRPGAAIQAVTLRSDPRAPASISFAGQGGPGQTVYFDPYTGAALGEGAKTTRNFFRVVTGLHRWFALEGASRATGRAITGACNLGFLFIVLSGFYLWWPRSLTWPQFKNILWFRRGLPGKARDFNWHNVIGFWSLVPLVLIVASGVVISYQWAGNLVYRAVGEQPPRPGAPPAANAAPPRERALQSPSAAPSFDGLNQAWARAAQQTPNWRSINLRLPNAADAPLAFTIDEGNGGQPQKRATLTLNRQTGEVVRWEPFASLSPGRRLRSFLRFAHTGEFGGIIGQTLAGVVTLGACFLVWTGLALTWRRFAAWRQRRARVAEAPVTV